ncbi:unnamed protein product [Nesidiocoris tenuis]|uniref:Uncharacterized protein n=1 Tax=Nesidiocoris tenuis TaxID=355587 RepID=A0A6H5GTI2_9HEMI|nr:unnamed protein product [Nesidiocoris tenuis]
MSSSSKRTVKFTEIESDRRAKKRVLPKETKTSRGRKKFVEFQNGTARQSAKSTPKAAAPRFLTPPNSILRRSVSCRTPPNTLQGAYISAGKVAVSVGDTKPQTTPKSASVDSKTAKVVPGLQSWLAKRGRPYLFTSLDCAASDLTGRLRLFQAGAKCLDASPGTNVERIVGTRRRAICYADDFEENSEDLAFSALDSVDSMDDPRAHQLLSNPERPGSASEAQARLTSPEYLIESRALKKLDISGSLADTSKRNSPVTKSADTSSDLGIRTASKWQNEVFGRSRSIQQQDSKSEQYTGSPSNQSLQHGESQFSKKCSGYGMSPVPRSAHAEEHSGSSSDVHSTHASPELLDAKAVKKLNFSRSLADAFQKRPPEMKSADSSSETLSEDGNPGITQASVWKDEVFGLSDFRLLKKLNISKSPRESANSDDSDAPSRRSLRKNDLHTRWQRDDFHNTGKRGADSGNVAEEIVDLQDHAELHLPVVAQDLGLPDSFAEEVSAIRTRSSRGPSVGSSLSPNENRPAPTVEGKEPRQSPDSKSQVDDSKFDGPVSPKTSHAEALEDLLNLTGSGFSPRASRDWLSVMLSVHPEIRDEPLFPKCLSAIEESDSKRRQLEIDSLERQMGKLEVDSAPWNRQRRILGELPVGNLSNIAEGKIEDETPKRKRTAFHSAYFDHHHHHHHQHQNHHTSQPAPPPAAPPQLYLTTTTPHHQHHHNIHNHHHQIPPPPPPPLTTDASTPNHQHHHPYNIRQHHHQRSPRHPTPPPTPLPLTTTSTKTTTPHNHHHHHYTSPPPPPTLTSTSNTTNTTTHHHHHHHNIHNHHQKIPPPTPPFPHHTNLHIHQHPHHGPHHHHHHSCFLNLQSFCDFPLL